MSRITRALISVSDKTGLVDFAQGLVALEVALISTGGTAKALAVADIPHANVSDVTQFPEMLEGRVKTLHPAIHGGILADRSKPEHMTTIAEHGIKPIDLVVVNLYPFAQTVARPGALFAEAIENIDIGGPSMVRSAAKNQAAVAVVVSPEDYSDVLDEMQRSGGELSDSTRRKLAAKAFSHTAVYDSAIAKYLTAQLSLGEKTVFPETLALSLTKVQDLRYGENPHQQAAFYRDAENSNYGIAAAQKLNGKELSFNNIYDLNAAYGLAQDLATANEAAAVIIKHTNPCGASIAPTLAEAFQKARSGDPISAFGGILATSQPIDAATAELITGKNTFFEAIIAPGYDADAVPILTEKKQWGANLILLRLPNADTTTSDQLDTTTSDQLDYKRVSDGFLVQTLDADQAAERDLTTVTRREPTQSELQDLLFAWQIVKHVKSNAIVIVKDRQMVGVGAGQMNRVQSVRLATEQAGEKAQGASLASDAFFPFADGPEAAGKAGVSAIIQPGGSKKDTDTVAMADTYNMAMVLTGKRHFKH